MKTFTIIIALITIFIILGIFNRKKETVMMQINTNSLRGIMALGVVLHHIAQRTSIDNSVVTLFARTGFLMVAVFLFLSGYGNWKKIEKDGLDGKWLKNRMLGLFTPYLFLFAVSTLVDYIFYHKYNLIESLHALGRLELATWNNWYMIVQFFLYVFLFVTWFVARKKKDILLIMFVVVVGGMFAFMIQCQKPTYWTNTVFCFFLGMFVARTEKIWSKMNLLQNGVMVIGAAYLFAIGWNRQYWKSQLFWEILMSLSFCIIIYVLNRYLNIQSKVLALLGKVSFEIYLCHLIFTTMFFDNAYGKLSHNRATFMVLFIAFAIVFGYYAIKKFIHVLSQKKLSIP